MNRFLFGVLFLAALTSCGPAIIQTKPYSPEVELDVPYEPNLGDTCFSSSLAMVIRYWGKDVHVDDVVRVVGLPPFKVGYEHPELNAWMKKNHRLEFLYLPGSRIEDIKLYIQIKGENLPICQQCWSKIADQEEEWY